MDLLKAAAARDIVRSEMEAFRPKKTGEDLVILCPFHDDKTPSLHVHIGHKIFPGTYHCFACGSKGGWNNLANVLNLRHIDTGHKPRDIVIDGLPGQEQEPDPFKLLLEEIKRNPPLTIDEPKRLHGTEPLPQNFEWRGLGKSVYEVLGAKYYWEDNKEYLYFPLEVNHIYKGYTTLNLDRSEKKIYAKATEVLFLYDYIPQQVPIVLVEGHFDAIRLFAEGFFPLCIFGVQNWSDIKRDMVIAKEPTKVLIAFDGDDAGYEAAQKVFCDFRACINVDIFYLPRSEKKLDPGNMGPEYLDLLAKEL